MSKYVKTFTSKDRDKDKNKNNKLISSRVDYDKISEKCKTIWTKIKDLQNIELSALPVHGNRFIKTKIKTYGDKVYTNFCGLNVPEDGVGCRSFTIISINSLFVYENKYYLQVYLDGCAYKTVDKQMIDYLDNNLFKSDED